MKIKLTKPSILESDIENVVDVLKSGMLVQGDNVKFIEKVISDYVGVKYSVAVANGTATLHLSLLALGTGPGDEVIVPAFSYIATANVVELVGATPVFIDINKNTFNINQEEIESSITERTRAIIPVHEFGHPAYLSKIMKLSEKYDVPIIEDAACALGAEWHGKKVGSFGIAGSFSFHPRKSVTSGEGGVITTNNRKLAHFFRVMRNHGIDDAYKKVEFTRAGFNYRLTEIQAALLLGQLKRIETINDKREKIAIRYNKELNGCFFRKPQMSKHTKPSWQSYHIVLDDSVDRNRFVSYLNNCNIGVSYGAQNIPMQNYYKSKYNYDDDQFPVAKNAYLKGVVLPIYDGLSEQQVSFVIKKINSFTEV